jgi:hypothetical protein
LTTRYYPHTPAATPVCTLEFRASDSSFTGTSDSTFAASVFERCRDFISFGDDTSKSHKIDSTLYLSIYNSNNIIWFKNATAMVLHTTDTTGDSAISRTDTITGSSMYMAIENDTLKDSLAALPVSTHLSRRTAVFKMDFSSFWDSVSTCGFPEIISASIMLKTTTVTTGSSDTTPTVYYFISDKLITNGQDLVDSLNHALDRGYYLDFTVSKSIDTVLSVSRHLQYDYTKKPSTYYLYLQIASSNTAEKQEIYWRKPLLKAILTTIK